MRDELRAARLRAMGPDNPPAATLVGVQSLAQEDWLIEVEVTAAIPERGCAALMNLILCDASEVDRRRRHAGRRGPLTSAACCARARRHGPLGVVDGPGRGEVLALDEASSCCARGSSRRSRPCLRSICCWRSLGRKCCGASGPNWRRRRRTDRADERLARRAPLLRHAVLEESTYRPLLIEGLQQAGDTRLPRVSIHRQLRVLVEDELEPVSGEDAPGRAPGGQRSPLATRANRRGGA